jgi:phosphoribosylaminoimidazole-succinocarboxamide synthase
MSTPPTVLQTNLPGHVHRGKVRDIYDLGDQLLLVATDRLSAYDVVMDDPIPGKGAVLTALAAFWFNQLAAARPHHLIRVMTADDPPPGYDDYADQLAGRAMLCRKTDVLPIECVVRGYLVGGGWQEYRRTGHVSGLALPAGLELAQPLPEPIFTPSTKATRGHDEPISFEQACDQVGGDIMRAARERSLAIYSEAAAFARDRGIIIADTKFEFGQRDGELLLIDEVLTPDSSRFWPADQYAVGAHPPSFDKQFVRDYLSTLDWDKTPPPPRLPPDIIAKTADKYAEVARRLMA